jgi:hypothetical protein
MLGGLGREQACRVKNCYQSATAAEISRNIVIGDIEPQQLREELMRSGKSGLNSAKASRYGFKEIPVPVLLVINVPILILGTVDAGLL